jgi:hypothetical protein
MAIGAIGNAIYVNQQTASASSVQSNQHNRFDLQNVMAQEVANEKEKEVTEVRPAEENQEVDEDREHQRDEADQETEARKRLNEHDDEEDEEESDFPHRLDIKV